MSALPDDELGGSTHPGPKRAPGAPVGPDEVRAAVIDAAGRLFAERGVHRVTLRDIAAEADVQLTLIGRYLGRRDDVIDAVYRSVAADLVAELEERALQRVDWTTDGPSARWLALLVHHAVEDQQPPPDAAQPVRQLATMIEDAYGLDDRSARRRAAQVFAIAIGWRLFEDFLVEEAGLEDEDRELLRDDLNAMQHAMATVPMDDR